MEKFGLLPSIKAEAVLVNERQDRMVLSTAHVLKDDHLAIVKDYRFNQKSPEASWQNLTDSKISEASKLDGSLLGKRKNEKTSDEALI